MGQKVKEVFMKMKNLRCQILWLLLILSWNRSYKVKMQVVILKVDFLMCMTSKLKPKELVKKYLSEESLVGQRIIQMWIPRKRFNHFFKINHKRILLFKVKVNSSLVLWRILFKIRINIQDKNFRFTMIKI